MTSPALGCDPGAADAGPAPDGRCVLTPLETEMVRKLRGASTRIRQLCRLAVLPDLTVRLQRRLGLR